MRLDLDEIEKALRLIKRLNRASLADVVFVRNGKVIMPPTTEQITKWSDTGLNNRDFVSHYLESGMWPTFEPEDH